MERTHARLTLQAAPVGQRIGDGPEGDLRDIRLRHGPYPALVDFWAPVWLRKSWGA